jgi:hypothetical protein
MLISDYPEDTSFYDCFFNIEASGWSKFNLEAEMADAQIAYNDFMPS